MRTFSSEHLTACRPDVFRALGPAEPPAMLRAGEADFRLLECLKHDSWAATAQSCGRCRTAPAFRAGWVLLVQGQIRSPMRLRIGGSRGVLSVPISW